MSNAIPPKFGKVVSAKSKVYETWL
jgi:hypothetical protein